MNWIDQIYTQALSNANKQSLQKQFCYLLGLILISYLIYQFYYYQTFTTSGIVSIILIVLLFLLLISNKTFVIKPIVLLWMILGLLLGELSSLIVLSIIFILFFTPIAFILRLFNKSEYNNEPKWKKISKLGDYHKLY